MTAAEKIDTKPAKARRKTARARRLPVYLVAQPMIDPDSGNRILAFVAADKADKMICRERGYKRGDILRAEISLPRNPKFNRLVHGLGTLVRRNIESYAACKDAHDVIKRLQRESGVCCDEQDIDVPGLGRLVVKVAQSLAFDSLNEEEFHAFWRGICAYLVSRYWHDMDEDKIAEMIDLMPEVEA